MYDMYEMVPKGAISLQLGAIPIPFDFIHPEERQTYYISPQDCVCVSIMLRQHFLGI